MTAPLQQDPGFVPPRLLRHAHLQAALASSHWRRNAVQRDAAALLAASREEIIECQDGVRLLAHTTPAADPGAGSGVAVLLHGWEGNSCSSHVLSAAVRLWRQGLAIVRVNMRDHGGSHHLNRGIFHSCRLAEMIDAVGWVRARYPDAPVYLAGFSLGGNFALRIAADAGARFGLAGVLAVCPVLDPEETLRALDAGSAIYRVYFLTRWRQSLERKAEVFPAEYRFGSLRRFRSLEAMTDFFVTHYTEYPDLRSYLRGYAVTGSRLAALATPTRILVADDDPVIPASGLSRLAPTPSLLVERSRFGGHCGFVADLRLRTWLDDYIAGLFRPAGATR